MQGAVGVAQLKKVRDVTLRRIALGRQLTDLIADAPGVTVVPLQEDRETTWWNYIFHVTGHDPDRFCEALGAEGVSAGAHYIGDPIFMCGSFLTEKNTYGKSGFPFTSDVTSREYKYTGDIVPNAVKALSTVCILRIHEHMAEEDIRDMGEAIQKVARGL